jgi:hypothetical protein
MTALKSGISPTSLRRPMSVATVEQRKMYSLLNHKRGIDHTIFYAAVIRVQAFAGPAST